MADLVERDLQTIQSSDDDIDSDSPPRVVLEGAVEQLRREIIQRSDSKQGSRQCSEGETDTICSDDGEMGEEAGQIFVMMGGTFRVSRNTRAQWFLQFLNKSVVWNADVDVQSDDKEPLEIISCIPRRPAYPVDYESNPCTSNRRFKITPHTAVTFLSKTYRLVFALDLTPSMAAVCGNDACVAFDELLHALRECLTAISQPAVIPGTSKPFTPKVFVTVFAHAPFLGCQSAPVMVKGFKLLPETLPKLLLIIEEELASLENDVVRRFNEELRRHSSPANSELRPAKPFMTMDMTLSNILRKGLLSVQLLPDNSCGHIIVVTDGIVDFPDINVLDVLLSSLRTHTVSVSFIRVACQQRSLFECDFGHICNVDLMEFIARTTTGAYVEYQPRLGELDGTDASVFQTAFFTWTFQRGVDKLQTNHAKRSEALTYEGGLSGRMMRKFLTEATIDVSLGGLLSIRLREGFTINSVSFSRGDTHIDIILTMPWKPEINLLYHIGAPWPPTEGLPVTVEIYVEAPYEFLFDLSCAIPKSGCGPYRMATLKRFRQMVESLEQTDQFLLHFEQFKSKPAHYTVPEIVREGMPVFYLPPDDSDNPILSSGDLETYSDFANFWRPLCVMDINLWHKWLHVHRLSILLEHDRPLVSNIFSSRRMATVRCSLALNQLHDLLRKWSTIVLVDCHSYIRFIPEDTENADAPPRSFFIVRMGAKPPCVVLRLAFLGGTSGNVRHKVIKELEDKLASLAVQFKENPAAESTAVLCCWKFAKPVEKMLIQYKDAPGEMFTPKCSLSSPPVQEKTSQSSFPVANPAASHALSRFLYCRRYVWKPLKTSEPVLYFDVIGRILTTLARLRLKEGFRFASTSGGVFNLTIEIPMKNVVDSSSGTVSESCDDPHDFPPCVAQYIIFPPRNVAGSITEETEGEVSRKLSVAVEIWLEPQYGLTVASSPQTAFLDGLKYQEIPAKIHELDCELLSTFLTFETLVGLCTTSAGSSRKSWSYREVPNPLSRPVSVNRSRRPSAYGPPEEPSELLDFPFDIPCLLAKCHTTRMKFCSFRSSHLAKNVTDANNLLFRFFMTEIRRLHAREIRLTEKDCHSITQILRDGYSLTGEVDYESQNEGDYVDSGENSGPDPESLLTVASPDWRCFVKLISDQTLIITLIPASYGQLRKITEALEIEDIEGPSVGQVLSGTSSGDRSVLSSGENDSETHEESLPRRPSALPLPVFLFTCSYAVLQTTVVERRPVNRKSHFDYDLTQQFITQYEKPLGKRFSESKEDGLSISDKNSTRSMSFPSRNSRDSTQLWLLCGRIDDAFAKGFVQGVYRSLHLNYDVDPYDIQQASDGLCEEHPEELDLTPFLRAVCPQFRRLSRRRRTSGNSAKSADITADYRFAAKHSHIKAQFLEIISSCLRKISVKPDVWYFCPPGFRGGESDSSLDSEPKKSDTSDETVEFRIDGGSTFPVRESVSGVSDTVESGHGFFDLDPEIASLNSDFSVASVFGSYPSEMTTGNIEDGEDDDDLLSPLFVEFFCTLVSTASGPPRIIGSSPIQYLPTRIGEVFSCVEIGDKPVDYSELQIRLDILCLSLPEELKDIQLGEVRSAPRTLSGGSSVKDLRGSDSDVSMVNDEVGSLSIDQQMAAKPRQPKQNCTSRPFNPSRRNRGDNGFSALSQLPPQQYDTLKGMLDNLKWHLRDEIAFTLSTGDTKPTEENLLLVMDHVKTSKARKTCVQQHLPLRFVFNVDQSYEKFLERLDKISILASYHFTKEGELYYLTFCEGSPAQKRRIFNTQVSSNSDRSDGSRRRAPTMDLEHRNRPRKPPGRGKTSSLFGLRGANCAWPHPCRGHLAVSPRRSSLPLAMLHRESHGIINSINNADIKAFGRLPPIRDTSVSADEDSFVFEDSGSSQHNSITDDAYDAERSHSDDESDTQPDPADGTELPGFWLILKFTPTDANLFFHVRECEVDPLAAAKHSRIVDETLKKLKATAKLVNQELLLRDLLATRRCNNLVEPETNDEIWKGNTTDIPRENSNVVEEEEAVDSFYLEASRHFQPGFFRCEMVYSYEFSVHPRLKLGPGRPGISRGMQALMTLLSKFAIVNRQNMFVFQERQKELYGAIFYIRMHEKVLPRRHVSGSEEPISSRGGSLGKEMDLLTNNSAENSPRVITTSEDGSYCEAFGASSGKDAIFLLFYGICPVSEEISQDLISALQNRLDDAVLEMLILQLTRNPMLKLNFEDIKFIQPQNSEPSEVWEIDFPEEIKSHKNHSFQVFHYLLQNLGGYLHSPKYLESDAGKHFHFVDVTTGRWRTADDDASFLYNRPQESGGKGIGFVYVELVSKPVDTKNEYQFQEDLEWEERLEKLTQVRSVVADGSLRFLVWEKGDIDRPSLFERLRLSVRHAFMDFWLENQILPVLSSALPVENSDVLEKFLRACVDSKSSAHTSTNLQLPSRRCVDLISESIVGMVFSQNLLLSLSCIAHRGDGSGNSAELAELLVENPKAMKDFLSPLANNLPPGTFVQLRLLGISTDEDNYDRRPRSISTEVPADEKNRPKTAKRFLSKADHTETAMAPRGRLFFLKISDVDCQLFTYNFSSEAVTTFDKSIQRLFEWQHERHRFLNSVLLQKCGIHPTLKCFTSNPPADFPPFTAVPMQVDFLVNYASPPSKENIRNLQNPKYASTTGFQPFESVMENCVPMKFFADESRGNYDDPVQYHGKQFLEVRMKKKLIGEVRSRLRALYYTWQHRDRRCPVSESFLVLLKNNSKPSHFCASPLLFDPHWRKNLGTRFPDRQLLCSSPIQRSVSLDDEGSVTGNRSRHNSGAPTPTKDRPKPAASNEGAWKSAGPSQDHIWHTQIRTILMQEYVHYLQMQGFSVVFARPPSPPRHVKKSPQGTRSRGPSGTTSPNPNADPHVPPPTPRFTPAVTYLQRCVPGGMILLELFFMEPFFFSRLFAVDRCKFSDDYSMVGNDPDKALINLQREVDRVKVAMHMHSFLYDFHLRCITRYMSGKHAFFRESYHLVSFFDDFGNYYQKAPSFARSCFQAGTLTIPCGSTIPAIQLYKFILAHDKEYGLNAVKMAPVVPEEDSDTSFALASRELPCATDEGFECTFIVYSDAHEAAHQVHLPGSSNLQLRYYIILTSKDDGYYSTDHLEERFDSFKTLPPPRRPARVPAADARKTSLVPPTTDTPQNTPQDMVLPPNPENLDAKSSLVAAFPNFLYIGYFSRLETKLNSIIENQRAVLETFMKKVLQRANSDCVRDTLWQRLTANKSTNDESRRIGGDGTRTRHSTESEVNALHRGRLTTDRLSGAEFEDLLHHVYKVPVTAWDPMLALFFQGNPLWIEGLVETMKVKYWDTHRHFVSEPGTIRAVQHLVVVSPALSDVALYLSLRSGDSASDARIISRHPVNLGVLKENDDFKDFIAGFINACCFHSWKNLLSS